MAGARHHQESLNGSGYVTKNGAKICNVEYTIKAGEKEGEMVSVGVCPELATAGETEDMTLHLKDGRTLNFSIADQNISTMNLAHGFISYRIIILG